jgi:hypothetical protein
VPIPAKNQDAHAVANAGLLLPATLGQRLGVEAIVDQLVKPGDRLGPTAWPYGDPASFLRGCGHRMVIGWQRVRVAWDLSASGCG